MGPPGNRGAVFRGFSSVSLASSSGDPHVRSRLVTGVTGDTVHHATASYPLALNEVT
jgi:hypothetical protein